MAPDGDSALFRWEAVMFHWLMIKQCLDDVLNGWFNDDQLKFRCWALYDDSMMLRVLDNGDNGYF